MPAKAGNDAVGGARVLHLDHRALAGLIGARFRLGDHPIEPRALEARQPIQCDGAIPCCGGEIHRGRNFRQQPLELNPALALRCRHQIASPARQQIEGNKGSRCLLRQLLHPRGRGMEPELQRVKIQPLRGRNHDLAVHHAVPGQLLYQRVVQFRKVAIERPGIAALDVNVVRAAKHNGTKPVPLGLVQIGARLRELVRELRQHRLDRRRERKLRGCFGLAFLQGHEEEA
jgi:hypothetical protein